MRKKTVSPRIADDAPGAVVEVPTAPAAAALRVAYRDGPSSIVFAGRAWRKGVGQEITRTELASMSRRAGWVLHGFAAAN